MVSSARISSLYDPLVAFFRLLLLLRLCSTRFDIQVNGLEYCQFNGRRRYASERTDERTS